MRADDVALLFGCVAFVAASILLLVILPTTYWLEPLILDPYSTETIQKIIVPGVTEKILHFQQMQDAHLTLIWTSIFSVKFAFIFFFRPMIDRLKGLVIYWRIIASYTTLAFCVCVSSTFILCPTFGIAAVLCVEGPNISRTVGILSMTGALDISTDVLSTTPRNKRTVSRNPGAPR